MAGLEQTQRLEQTQGLTPAQLLAVKMLEVTSLELETRIEQELEENPALEENYPEEEQRSGTDEGDEDGATEQDWELGEYAQDDIPEYKLRELQERQSVREEIPFAAGAPSLEEQLLEQLSMVTELEGRRYELARYIVGSIDADGYLTRSVEELQDDLLFKAGIDARAEELEELIALVKTLDPPGVGARDLREALLLQLQRLPEDELSRAADWLIREHYEDFVNKRFDRLCSALGIDEQRLSELYAFIARLSPRPASGLGDGELQVSLVGEREIAPLRLSPTYLELLEAHRDQAGQSRQSREAMTFLKHKVEQARWFIEALETRQQTLRRTMKAIVEHQRDFFFSGEVSDLKPMVLRDIAEATGLDISTISRVSNSKSVQTDHGIYMLKFFFGEGITTEEGESISTREVRQALAALIEGEDKRQPLTDEELTQQLAAQGYPIARRTVAKYREQLRLPIARLRRQLP